MTVSPRRLEVTESHPLALYRSRHSGGEAQQGERQAAAEQAGAHTTAHRDKQSDPCAQSGCAADTRCAAAMRRIQRRTCASTRPR